MSQDNVPSTTHRRGSRQSRGIGTPPDDREPSPSAGIIDNQSGKTTERGYDPGKKVKASKRQLVTDTP